MQRDFHLGWSHYRLLLRFEDFPQRRFYFEQAAIHRWSSEPFSVR